MCVLFLLSFLLLLRVWLGRLVGLVAGLVWGFTHHASKLPELFLFSRLVHHLGKVPTNVEQSETFFGRRV